jgi:DNA-binding transcriptional regulator YhcF (GntR family)
MSLKITVNAGAATAPYEQLREQIAAQAREGRLPVGYKLPTVRGLAEQLGLAANTVAKAYRVLEADGVIETRGRHGTYIAAADARAREVAAAAAEYVARTRRLGLDRDAARAAVDEALRAADEG